MKADRALLLSIITLLLVLSVFIVLPYLQYVLAAFVLAFVLRPMQQRLQERVGRTPAAAALVVLSIVTVVVPFLVIGVFVANDVMQMAASFEEGDLTFDTVEEPIEEFLGVDLNLAGAVSGALESIATFDGVVAAFGTLTHLLVGLSLLVFLLFFIVRDSDHLMDWLRDVSPTPDPVTNDLVERVNAITMAVLLGHVLVAIIQGLLAGVGLFVTGISNAVFWTFVMVLLGLIPIIGTFAVWAPASVYLYATGSPVAAVGLFVYGAIIVGSSDNYLRPVLVDRYASVSPSVIIIGVIGGLTVFGFMGLFVGPIVVGALKETIEVYDEHYGERTRYPTG